MENKKPLPYTIYLPNDWKGIFSDEFYEKLFEVYSRSAKPITQSIICRPTISVNNNITIPFFIRGYVNCDHREMIRYGCSPKVWNHVYSHQEYANRQLRHHIKVVGKAFKYCGQLPVNYYL